jgi:hypothetical protein
MKVRSLSALLLGAFCLAAGAAAARNPIGGTVPKHHNYKEEAGSCNIPVDQFDMDVNNVRARLLDAGDQWWDLSNGKYEVPKGDITSTTPLPQAIFAGAIWISALDQGNNLKIAALEYRQGTTDYFTGPLDDNGNTTLSTCNKWDQHFRVYGTDIKACQLAYLASSNVNVPISTVVPSPSDSDVIRWPGKGNPLLDSEGYQMSGVLAPFFDANGDGIYNPLDGDYPTIKQGGLEPATQPGAAKDSLHYINGFTAYADEMVFWVMNDAGNIHTASNGAPIGVQVNELAFAFQSSDEINNMTFYTYNIINKSGADLHSTYMSQWTDVDLGCANNDRVGCDVPRKMAVQYNGILGTNACDNGTSCPTSEVGYGCNLPMLGIVYFEGPTDTATVYDSATHTRNPLKLGMTSFCYFTNGAATGQSDPTTASGFRNYQTGFWNDGTPITYGGTGYNGSTPTPYCFPGDPSISTQWSECSAGLTAGDRRFVQTSGPFYFRAWAAESITIGVIFVDPPGGVGSTCPSFSFLYTADDKAQALFDNNFQQLQGPSAPVLKLTALDQKVIINFFDDSTGNNIGETYAQIDPLRVRKGFVSGSPGGSPNPYLDSVYRFQGYVLYQLADATVSSSDLADPTKAIPVAVYDIKDTIAHLVNWDAYTDAITGTNTSVPETSTIPGVGNNLPNTGIKHSLIDSIDLINGGQMVNHLTYYFGVLSFATNNFKLFNPLTDTGQTTPFLIGKNFNKYSVVPENSEATDGGRILNSSWGTSTQVRRIEGQGNGGNYIDLDATTISSILSSSTSSADTLDYVVGQDPLAFQVTDPILLHEANFELIVFDTIHPYNGNNVSPQAWWVLYDLTNNVEIHSNSTLNKPYQQNILDALGDDYGFAISVGTPLPVYTNLSDNLPVYGPLASSVSFADPSKPWLSFLADSGQNIANHWIRSGVYQLACAATNPDVDCNVFVSAAYHYSLPSGKDTTQFTDPYSYFDTMASAQWAPYSLAANWSMAPGQAQRTGPNNTIGPLSVGGPGFKWDRYDDKAASPENNLDQLQSVDIVLTSDKSKWSYSMVFETGDNPVLDYVQAPDGSTVPPRKGMLRNHLGLNIDSTVNPDPAQWGMSWFPGYAINVETGQRLDIAFGEASDEGDQNGRDMVWNPTSKLFGGINQGSDVPYTPIFGGKHFIYILNSPYGQAYNNIEPLFTTGTLPDGSSLYTLMVNTSTTSAYSYKIEQNLRPIYQQIMWTAIPYLTPGYSLNNWSQGLIPNDVTIRLRVQKSYNKYTTNATANSSDSVVARYSFSTIGLGPKTHVDSVAVSALDKIRIVPNPYLAYSAYETSANDAEIKVTNLPNNCTIKIYTLDGVLVRTLSQSLNLDPVAALNNIKKPIEITDGYDLNSNSGGAALDNSIKWDLKNQAAIPVASGIYLFDIEVPGVGHKILKWFGAVRPSDVTNF